MRLRIGPRDRGDDRHEDGGTKADRSGIDDSARKAARYGVLLAAGFVLALGVNHFIDKAVSASQSAHTTAKLTSKVADQQRTLSRQQGSIAHLTANQARELASFKAQTAQHRAQNKRTLAQLKRQTDATHSLAVQIGQLANQRAADNEQAIAAQGALSQELKTEVGAVATDQSNLSRAEAKIRTLQASQHEQTLEEQYNTCVQVEALRRSIVVSLDLAFPPGKLSPSAEKGLQRILAQFKPQTCMKP